MTDHIRKSWYSLKNMSRSTVFEILNEAEIRPHRIRCYVEKRDHDFWEKMKETLGMKSFPKILLSWSEEIGFRLESNLRGRVYFRGMFYDQLYHALLKK